MKYLKKLLFDNRGFLGFVGDIVSAAIGYKGVQDTNQANIDLWREQAAYNKPINQVARWREAGLNPNLIYGQGTSGNIQNLPKQEAPTFDMDFMRKFVERQTIDNMKEQNKNLQEQNKNLSAESKAKELQNEITQNKIELNKKYGLPLDTPVMVSSLLDLSTDNGSVLSNLQQDVPLLRLISNFSRFAGEKVGQPQEYTERLKDRYKTQEYVQNRYNKQYWQSNPERIQKYISPRR